MPSEKELKGLQVKAELDKLGDAPRIYSEKIKADSDMDVDQHKTSSNAGHIHISDRFDKIQNAKRILPMGSMIGKYQNRLQGPIAMR